MQKTKEKQETMKQTTEQKILELAEEAHVAMTKLQNFTSRQSWYLTNDAVEEVHDMLHEIQIAALQTVQKVFPEVSKLAPPNTISGWQFNAPGRHPRVKKQCDLLFYE